MNSSLSDLRGMERGGDASGAPSVPAPGVHWKTRFLLPGLIIVIVFALILLTSAHALWPAVPVRVVPVVMKSVQGAAGTVTVQAPGWIEPDPHPYFIAALASGVVEEMLVLEGSVVEAGQVVARLVDDDARLALQRAEAELQQRRAELQAAGADLAAARLRFEHLIEPARAVAVGEASVAEARAALVQVRSDIAVERAQLAELQDEYDRKSQLTESQAVSEATVARLRLRLNAQEASLDAVVAREDVLEAKLAQADAELDAARTDRELLITERQDVALAEAAVGAAEAAIALAEAAREEAELRLSRMEVRTPVGGVVMQRLASPGSRLTLEGPEHSSHVVHVYDPEHLQVRVDVPLADAALVSVDQGAEITVEVLPDHVFTGHVTRVVHQADIQKNTVEVKVAIDEPARVLKPEMLARVRFIGQSASSDQASRQRVFAPASLLREDGDGGAMVWVITDLVDDRGRAEGRSVVAGSRRHDDWIEIESGLQPGDLLVADPAADLESGDRVRVIGEQLTGVGG